VNVADARVKLERIKRLERLRQGEERLARTRYQQALANERDIEAHLEILKRAYQDILEDGNRKLRGEVNVRRLPLLQLMVADSRRAVENAQRSLNAASAHSERMRTAWLAARTEMRIMESATTLAKSGWQGAVRGLEQHQLDEITVLRHARKAG